MSECIASSPDGNLGLAFGIVTAAGLSTTLGAALAFVMPYSQSPKNLFLATCLSVAAGVMIYVSFVEIFTVKAVEEFTKCYDEAWAYLYATLCFFGGIAITAVFDAVLHHVQGKVFQHKSSSSSSSSPQHVEEEEQKQASHQMKDHKQQQNGSDSDKTRTASDTSSVTDHAHVDVDVDDDGITRESSQVAPTGEDDGNNGDQVVGHGGHLIASLYQNQEENNVHDSKALIRMGIFAGIALAFHNFPEGLATFVAVLEDPSVGVSVAIAIAIHNIPEGVCVAMPIYYATGSRLKAFFWATASGMTELVGALIGWLVLRNVITPTVYAILFGVVAGMMVYISFKELIPTAHRYDKDDQVTSIGVVAGMIIMAVSLVLFQF